MSLSPPTFEEAKASHKPLKRTGFVKGRLYGFSVPETRLSPAKHQQSLSRKAVKKPKKKKKLTTGQWKKKAWTEFSIFIRTRGADSNGHSVCITCNERIAWKSMQAGHFIRGRLNSNLFDERGCWVQCLRCNIHLQGNVVVFYKFMLAKYGQEVIDELMRQNDETHKWVPGELQSIWEKYKALNAVNPLFEG